jgi:hypothetical protein
MISPSAVSCASELRQRLQVRVSLRQRISAIERICSVEVLHDDRRGGVIASLPFNDNALILPYAPTASKPWGVFMSCLSAMLAP